MGQCMPKSTTSFISAQDTESRVTEPEIPETSPAAATTNDNAFVSATSHITDMQKLPSKFGQHPPPITGGGPTSASPTPNMSTVSAPSAIDNAHMTTIYHIPDERYKTVSEVLEAHHIRLLSKIDEGGFAKVYLAMLADRKVACKVIDLGQVITGSNADNSKLTDVKNELFVLQKIKHPHIIRLHVHFIINDMLYIFMHYANAGNLFQFMQLHGLMSEAKAKRPFAQIVSGVAFMHAKCIAHRDLKLSNILLNSNEKGRLHVLIADFGLSRVVYRARRGVVLCKSYCGTPNYMAPELKRRKRYNAFAIDIYALGVMVFLLLNCAYPFDVKDDTKALAAMERNEPQLIWNPAVKPSESLLALVNWMLQPVVSRRITMPELIKAEWFRAEMEELKHCVPPPEAFEKLLHHQSQQQTLRRMSSPGDDVRLKPLIRQSSPAFSSFKHKRKVSSKENLNDAKVKRGSIGNFSGSSGGSGGSGGANHKPKERPHQQKSQPKIERIEDRKRKKCSKEQTRQPSKQSQSKEGRPHGKNK